MINLISPEQKRDIRAARINVILVRYSIMLVTLALLVGLIYGIGFGLMTQERNIVNETLRSQNEQSKTYSVVEKEAEIFRGNLLIAKKILGSEISYSTFLTTLANDMPAGSVITNLSLGTQATTNARTGMTIDARATSYAKVLELKDKLERSDLFENVNIVSASRPADASGLSGLPAKYLYEVSFNLMLSAQKTGSAS